MTKIKKSQTFLLNKIVTGGFWNPPNNNKATKGSSTVTVTVQLQLLVTVVALNYRESCAKAM